MFGCGGDRDRSKRAPMGTIAVQSADKIWITSDNPRSEMPSAIIQDILEGIRPLGHTKMAKVIIELDRSIAIREAIFSAKEGDTVLIAGKGHENYQIFKDVTIPFDDRESAKRWWRERVSQYV